MVTHFSQRDPEWADVKVGTGRQTLAQTGCLVCAAASVVVDSGQTQYDPGSLNRWLGRNGGFVGGNLFVFGVLSKLNLTLTRIVDCHVALAPMGDVKATLVDGGYVLAKVDFRPHTRFVDQHWVRIISVSDDDCEMMDPYLPLGCPVTSLMNRYARPSWDGPPRAIFRLAFYQSSTREVIPETKPAVQERRRWTLDRKL